MQIQTKKVDQANIERLEGELNHQEAIAENLSMNMESNLLTDYLKHLDPVYDKIVDLRTWIRILKQCR